MPPIRRAGVEVVSGEEGPIGEMELATTSWNLLATPTPSWGRMPRTSLRAWRRGTPTWPATCPRANLRGTNPGILGSKKIRNRTWEVPWDPVPERDYWAQDLGTSEHSQDTKEGLAQSITSAITRCHLSWHVVTMKRVTRGVMLDCEEPAISAMTYVCRQSSLHIVRTPPSVTTSHVLCHIIHLQNCGLLDKMMLIYLKILLTYISVRPFSHFRLCPPVFPWILCWDESSSTSYHKNQNHQRSHFRRIDSDLQVSCLFLLRKTAYLTY